MKLFSKKEKKSLEVAPQDVAAALDSGQFTFEKGQKVPINYEGRLMFTTPEYASKYRSRVDFVNEQDVLQAKAEERFGGVGGAAQAIGYGLAKSLTLGAVPALAASLSPEAAEYSRDIELGRPTLTAASELAGLAIDPFAAAGKVARGVQALREARAAQRAGKVAQTAAAPALALGRAAEGGAAQTAAEIAGAGAAQPAVELGAQRAMAAEVSPVALGRQALAPTAEEAAQLGFRERARRTIASAEPAPVEPMFPVAPGATATAEPGLRLGADIYRTPELAMRGRQAEELTARAAGARAAQTRAAEGAAASAEEAARLEAGFPAVEPGFVPEQAEGLRTELGKIDQALQANGAAARRAKSGKAQARVAAERDTLLAQRDQLEQQLFAAEAQEDAAAAAEGATRMRAAAGQRALEAERMGRTAGELEAANVIPPTLARAASRVEAATAEGARPLGEVGTMPTATPQLRLGPGGVSPTMAEVGGQIGEIATPSPYAAIRPTAGTVAAAPTGAITKPSAPGLALGTIPAQGAVYGASEEIRRQATGESEGGLGAVLGAGALGAAMPAAFTLGGKALAKGGGAAAAAAREAGFMQRVSKGAESFEKQHIIRAFDVNRDQVTRLNNKFAMPAAERQGTDVFASFIKGELDDVGKLKAAFPEDAFLQSIPEGTKLRFGQLTPDRKKAFADAVERFYGQQYDNIFTDAVKAAPVDTGIIQRIISKVKATRVPGAAQEGLESVGKDLRALEQYINDGNTFNVGSLKSLQSRVGESFRALQGEGGKFTESQAAMYGGLKQAIYDAVEAAQPGAAARLAETDVAYEMSKILSEGAERTLSKATTTSPFGRDQWSQFALGAFALMQPLHATAFLLGAVGLRHLYNTRGEGIIADMAGKVATNLRRNPALAATETADVIVNASRPMLLGVSAMKLTEIKPENYMDLSRAIRELDATRDRTKQQIADAVSGMSPDEQQKAMQFFDSQINALASKLPKGIPTGQALSEQEKNYAIFARAVLDPQGYGVQAIVNGGPGGSIAAEAINSLGPQGQEFLQKLGDDLQARISESKALRGRDDMIQVLRNVKTSTRKSVSIGGGANLRNIHRPQDVKNIGKGSASAFQNAAKAFGGASATKL